MSKANTAQRAVAIGKVIAKRRQAINLTQEQLAEILEIGSEAVSRIERGTVMPTLSRLIELADLFQCHVSALLTESSYRPDDQAQYLCNLLATLDTSDRAMIVDMVERLATRLVR